MMKRRLRKGPGVVTWKARRGPGSHTVAPSEDGQQLPGAGKEHRPPEPAGQAGQRPASLEGISGRAEKARHASGNARNRLMQGTRLKGAPAHGQAQADAPTLVRPADRVLRRASSGPVVPTTPGAAPGVAVTQATKPKYEVRSTVQCTAQGVPACPVMYEVLRTKDAVGYLQRRRGPWRTASTTNHSETDLGLGGNTSARHKLQPARRTFSQSPTEQGCPCRAAGEVVGTWKGACAEGRLDGGQPGKPATGWPPAITSYVQGRSTEHGVEVSLLRTPYVLCTEHLSASVSGPSLGLRQLAGIGGEPASPVLFLRP